MTRKNEQTVVAASQLLLEMAAYDKGMTAQQVMDALKIGKATAYRILNNEPGFVKAINPLYPTSYYYSAERAHVDIRRRAIQQASEVTRYEAFDIKTHLGIVRYGALADTAQVCATDPNKLIEFIPTVTEALVNAREVDPSAPNFNGDLDQQIKWFDSMAKASAACRAFYEMSRDLFEREEMQMADFWELFLKVR